MRTFVALPDSVGQFLGEDILPTWGVRPIPLHWDEAGNPCGLCMSVLVPNDRRTRDLVLPRAPLEGCRLYFCEASRSGKVRRPALPNVSSIPDEESASNASICTILDRTSEFPIYLSFWHMR